MKAKRIGMIPKATIKARIKHSKDAKRIGSFGILLKDAFRSKGISI